MTEMDVKNKWQQDVWKDKVFTGFKIANACARSCPKIFELVVRRLLKVSFGIFNLKYSEVLASAHTDTHTHAHKQKLTHTHKLTNTHMHKHTQTHTHAHAHIHTQKWINILSLENNRGAGDKPDGVKNCMGDCAAAFGAQTMCFITEDTMIFEWDGRWPMREPRVARARVESLIGRQNNVECVSGKVKLWAADSMHNCDWDVGSFVLATLFKILNSKATCRERWGVRCEVWGVRCEVWGVRCEVWGATNTQSRESSDLTHLVGPISDCKPL